MWFINQIFTRVHPLRSMSSKVVCIHTYIRVNGTMNAVFEHVKSYLGLQLAILLPIS